MKQKNQIDLSKYKNKFTFKNQINRMVWTLVWTVFAMPFPRRFCNGWKLLLLKLFGAKLHKTAVVYSSVKVYMPWNLEMHEYSCLGPDVDCYNVAKIIIGAHSTVSQKAYLCSASHDISDKNYPLVSKPITIKNQVWIGASAFIGMGVTIGEGSVVAATSSVYKDIDEWSVVGGNPSKLIKKRVIND